MVILYFKVLHLIGSFCLFLGFGGLFSIGKSKKTDRLVYGLHGAGLLLLFLSGFAIQGIGGYGFPIWLLLKIILWIVMVLLFVLIKRKVIDISIGILASLLIGGIVAWLCILKPF